MPELLNAVTSTDTLVDYDRSPSGSFENPYGGAPALTFNMHRVTVRSSDDAIVAAKSLPNVTERYVPGKVYDLYNPQTGEKIPGATFTAEQFQAMFYSTMIRSVLDTAAAKAAADAAAAEAAAAAAASAAAMAAIAAATPPPTPPGE